MNEELEKYKAYIRKKENPIMTNPADSSKEVIFQGKLLKNDKKWTKFNQYEYSLKNGKEIPPKDFYEYGKMLEILFPEETKTIKDEERKSYPTMRESVKSFNQKQLEFISIFTGRDEVKRIQESLLITALPDCGCPNSLNF